MDSLPYPAYDLSPLEEVYFKNSAMMYSEAGMRATRHLDINASIGCSLICRFCYHLGIAGDMRYQKDKNGNKLENDTDFVQSLLENNNVAVVQGSAFGLDGYFRISYATSMQNLKKAMERIKTFCESLS